jgi:hypothetical protein
MPPLPKRNLRGLQVEARHSSVFEQEDIAGEDQYLQPFR